MRLEPIEKPKNLMMKALYRYAKWRFGKVVTALKIIYARKPKFVAAYFLFDLLFNKGITLSPSFRLLFQTHVSMLNGCGFCQDARQALAVQRSIGQDKFQSLKDYRISPLFDDRERAALAFAEEFLKNKHVSDEIFAGLEKYFTKTEIIEIIWMNAAETYFNALSIPLGLESDGLRVLAENMRKKRERGMQFDV
jgi:alkylhydroperoxidase family enzyme